MSNTVKYTREIESEKYQQIFVNIHGIMTQHSAMKPNTI